MTGIVEMTGVSKHYGNIPVLKGVTFEVAPQSTFAIIGPNGAGKTTMFKALTGEIQVTAGTVSYQGADVTTMSASGRAAAGMGRTFQVARVFPELTVEENVLLAAEARDRTKYPKRRKLLSVAPTRKVRDAARQTLTDVGIETKASVAARLLSHGDRKRLDLAMTLALEPRVLMMDEPTAGMSPAERVETLRLLQRLKRTTSITIMLTEHDMDVVFGLADRIMVLNYGEIIALGSPDEIRTHPAVRAVYLGEEMHDA